MPETVLCGHCKQRQARKPGWGAKHKPVCGDCYMDGIQRADKGLHDMIAATVPGYEHRKDRR